MKKYSSKKCGKGKIRFRTPSKFIVRAAHKIKKLKGVFAKN